MAGDKIETAKSGRAGCRGCKEKIAKGELRFGEVDYAFDPDGSFKWYHLPCAAKKLPAKLQGALDDFEGEVPGTDDLLAEIAKGKKGKAFPRAEPAPSGRASCLVCSEKLKKGELRVAVEREVDTGSFTARRPGYMHPGCAQGSEFLAGVEDLAKTLRENSDLDDAKLAELEGALGHPPIE
jgi:poly [ADP-ribose] polymerase